MSDRPQLPLPADPYAGLRSLRMIVLIFILLDVLAALITDAPSNAANQAPTAVVGGQLLLVAAVAAAVMWRHKVLTVVLAVVLVALTLTVGPTGEELMAVLVVGVVAGARARRRQLVAVVAGLIGFAAAFGVYQESYRVGWGWPAGLTVLGFAVAALGVGVVVRYLFRADERRRSRVLQLETENAEIAALERTRLADDLQSVVTRGLREIDTQLRDVTPGRLDRRAVRAGLARVDALSRGLLDELRALLEVLRRDADPAAAATEPTGAARGWSRWLSVVTVQILATVAFGVLVVDVMVEQNPPAHPDHWIEAVGLAACGAALWRPWGTRVGTVVALAVLVFATLTHDTVGWDAVSVALLCLVGTARLGVRRSWLVLAGLTAYGGVRALDGVADPSKYLSLLGYAGVVGVLLGLATRHFLQTRSEADRRLDDLLVERDLVETQERNAVARELHDVVAHQLSVTTLVVMATGTSDDPDALTETVARVRRSTRSARHELDTLLHTMRGAEADAVQPTPLASLAGTTAGLRRRLVEQGFHPEFVIDAGADSLDPTSKRTLVRIMQEATTNVLRYTAAGSWCRYELDLGAGDVALTVVSPLTSRERRSDLSLGWGLRGIRERIELCHGTFDAGPTRGTWRLAVTLPLLTPESLRVGSLPPVPAANSAASATR